MGGAPGLDEAAQFVVGGGLEVAVAIAEDPMLYAVVVVGEETRGRRRRRRMREETDIWNPHVRSMSLHNQPVTLPR